MSSIGMWVKGIAACAVICGIALAVTPKGKVKNILSVISGVVLIIAFLQPFLDGDSSFLSMDMSQYRAQADEITGDAEKVQTNLSRTIIEENMNSYILDKAQTLGIDDLEVKVVLKWGDEGFWYPYELSLISNCGVYERNRLSTFIETELGVPSSRHYWSGHEDGEY